jgi:hypothetical protein
MGYNADSMEGVNGIPVPALPSTMISPGKILYCFMVEGIIVVFQYRIPILRLDTAIALRQTVSLAESPDPSDKVLMLFIRRLSRWRSSA